MLRLIKETEPPKPSTRLSGRGGTKFSAQAFLPAREETVSDPPATRPAPRFQELDWIAMKALDKDRSRRYETANGLARDLQRYLLDEPVEAGPPSSLVSSGQAGPA